MEKIMSFTILRSHEKQEKNGSINKTQKKRQTNLIPKSSSRLPVATQSPKCLVSKELSDFELARSYVFFFPDHTAGQACSTKLERRIYVNVVLKTCSKWK